MMTSLHRPEPRPKLRLYLLGAARWQLDDQPPVNLSPKDAALLAILALDGQQPRMALCELLWPHSEAEKMPVNLRNRAHRLAKAAGQPLVELGAVVRLHAGVIVDVADPAALPDEVLLSSPTLLAGTDLGDHGELDEWLAKARKRMAERCAQALTDRAEVLEQQGRLREALHLATQIVALVPLTEQAWRRLMRLHYLRGDRAAAQATYRRLEALLRDEIGAQPSAETQQMAQTIETATDAPATPRRPVPVSLLRPPVIVGRETQWAAMTAAWAALQPFLLVGEAGLGKTRLLEAFVQGREGLVFEAARPGDQASPDALLGRLLLDIEQRFSPPASAAVRAELARIRDEFGPRPTAPAHREVLRHAVETWLASALQCGLQGLVVDDLHYADDGFIEWLRWLGASPPLADLKLGLASRPWPTDAASAGPASWLADARRPSRIDLTPLTPAELSDLLASLALPSLLDRAAVARLHKHAGGHPMYTLATLQHAHVHGGTLPFAGALATPPSVTALLDARIQDLPATTRDLLQVAAVGGPELTVDRAARVMGCAPLALSARWGILEAHNILRGEAFSHDLVRDAALRSVPEGVQQSLHRRWAAVLAEESGVPHACIARHWEQGLQWSEAGVEWHRAGLFARRAGRLAEQSELFEHAARCHAQAGDRDAQFDALLARIDGLQIRHGGAVALAALAEIESWARTPSQRLRHAMAATESLLDQGRGAQATAAAQRALADAEPGQDAGLRAQLAMALAQSGRTDEALAESARASAAAGQDASHEDRLRAANAAMYANWSAGRVTQAISAQRDEMALAEQAGDRALAVASEGNLSSLLSAAGELRATYEHARHARERQRDCGLAENSSLAIHNLVMLGAAAARLAYFNEALDALKQATGLAGDDTAPDMRLKTGLILAGLWLSLGQPAQARVVLDALPSGDLPGLAIQAAWLSARIAEAAGQPADGAWQRFDALLARHPQLPATQSTVFEASYRGPAEPTIARLQAESDALAARGAAGQARALRWREMARWLDIDGAAATAQALRCAGEIEPHLDEGLGVKCDPPEVWLDLARVHERAGHADAQRACLARGRRWLNVALARMAPELRHAFLHANPVNHLLWSSGSA